MKTKTGLKAGQRNNTATITVNVAQNSGDEGRPRQGNAGKQPHVSRRAFMKTKTGLKAGQSNHPPSPSPPRRTKQMGGRRAPSKLTSWFTALRRAVNQEQPVVHSM